MQKNGTVSKTYKKRAVLFEILGEKFLKLGVFLTDSRHKMVIITSHAYFLTLHLDILVKLL